MNKTKVKEKDDAFASRVKAIRTRLKMTQKTFCEKLAISITSLSEIENNRSKPGYDFFNNLVNEFNVNMNYLMRGEGPIFLNIDEDSVKGDLKGLPVDHSQLGFKSGNEAIDEFLFYFFNSDYFRYKVMAEAVRTRNEFGEIIKNEIALHKPRDRK